MNNKIKNVLLELENHSYKAYIVGGFVRDYLLGIESYDVDISTSAKPKEVKEIFNLSNSNEDTYGRICIKDSLYNYDITTFRKEEGYENRKPVDIEFIDDIETDILRRDFTINALYMDSKGEIYDIVDGKSDLNNRIIRVIGNIESKMIEDPLRILRAVRFSSLFDFKIEDTLLNFIRQNTQLVRTLSYSRKKEELNLIFKSQNKLKGIKLIQDLKLESALDIKIKSEVVYTEDPLGIWAQIDYDERYPFSKGELEKIESIKKVLQYGIIDNNVLYEYGLYICIIAGDILHIARSQISGVYKNMPIYSVKDIAIDGNDVISLLNIEPGQIVKNILFDLEINILNGTLENEKNTLEQYIIDHWR